MSTIKLTLELTPEQLTKLLADLQGGSATPAEPDGKRRISDRERDTLVSLLEGLNQAKEQQTSILQELEAQRRLREHWEQVAEEATTKRDLVQADNKRLHQELEDSRAKIERRDKELVHFREQERQLWTLLKTTTAHFNVLV